MSTRLSAACLERGIVPCATIPWLVAAVYAPIASEQLEQQILKRRVLGKDQLEPTDSLAEKRVTVEGLKRAGKDLTRKGLIHGIEAIPPLNPSPAPHPNRVDYSAKDHKGFEHVIRTVVRGGRAVPFTDWAIVPQN